MNRNKFIKITGLVAAGLTILPQFSFSPFQDSFTRNQLIGKGNPDIIGDTYTTKMHKEANVAFQKMKVEFTKI